MKNHFDKKRTFEFPGTQTHFTLYRRSFYNGDTRVLVLLATHHSHIDDFAPLFIKSALQLKDVINTTSTIEEEKMNPTKNTVDSRDLKLGELSSLMIEWFKTLREDEELKNVDRIIYFGDVNLGASGACWAPNFIINGDLFATFDDKKVYQVLFSGDMNDNNFKPAIEERMTHPYKHKIKMQAGSNFNKSFLEECDEVNRPAYNKPLISGQHPAHSGDYYVRSRTSSINDSFEEPHSEIKDEIRSHSKLDNIDVIQELAELEKKQTYPHFFKTTENNAIGCVEEETPEEALGKGTEKKQRPAQ